MEKLREKTNMLSSFTNIASLCSFTFLACLSSKRVRLSSSLSQFLCRMYKYICISAIHIQLSNRYTYFVRLAPLSALSSLPLPISIVSLLPPPSPYIASIYTNIYMYISYVYTIIWHVYIYNSTNTHIQFRLSPPYPTTLITLLPITYNYES